MKKFIGLLLFVVVGLTSDSQQFYQNILQCNNVLVPDFYLKSGIMPYTLASSYHATVLRDEIIYNNYSSGASYVHRIAGYNKDSVIININNRVFFGRSSFVSDTVSYQVNLLRIIRETLVKDVVIENENDNAGSHYYDTNVVAYCNQLRAAVDALSPSGVRVYNGGLIYARLWYYWKTHDDDFRRYCLNNISSSALTQPSFLKVVGATDIQLNFFRSLPGLAGVNIHGLYVSDTSEFVPLLRMLNYIQVFTGKPLISNEVGILKSDPLLVIGLKHLAVEAKLRWCIFYCQDGTSAVAIPQSWLQ